MSAIISLAQRMMLHIVRRHRIAHVHVRSENMSARTDTLVHLNFKPSNFVSLSAGIVLPGFLSSVAMCAIAALREAKWGE